MNHVMLRRFVSQVKRLTNLDRLRWEAHEETLDTYIYSTYYREKKITFFKYGGLGTGFRVDGKKLPIEISKKELTDIRKIIQAEIKRSKEAAEQRKKDSFEDWMKSVIHY